MSQFSESRGDDRLLTPAECPEPDMSIALDASAKQCAQLGTCFANRLRP